MSVTTIEKTALQNNEYNANRQMIRVCVFMAIIMVIMFIPYLTKSFPLHDYTLVYIFFPVNIVVLSSTVVWSRSKFIYRSGFKYLLIFSVLSVVAMVNVIVPKHGIIGWTLALVLVNHYYSPRACKVVFIATLIAMFFCIYLGAFFGEYDPNLLPSGVRQNAEGEWVKYEPDSPQERFAYLHEWYVSGRNRYLEILIYYFIPRGLFITIIFFACNALNHRTFKMMTGEIESKKNEERISTELNLAKSIQLSALPHGFTTINGAEILAEVIPAKEVGGDLYEYAFLDDKHIAIFIGDVSGKGMPAAMFMMQAATCFKAYAQIGKTPSEILREMNRILYDGNEGQMFLTCFLAIIDRSNGQMVYANAGHNPPVIYHNGMYSLLPCSTGFVLASLKDTYVKDEMFKLDIGDFLLLYTDGLTEARNAKGEFFGEQRLFRSLGTNKPSSILGVRMKLLADVNAFTAGAPQSDDLTFLFFQYIGLDAKKYEVDLPATQDGLDRALVFIENALNENRLPHLWSKAKITVDEIFSNIVKYAYEDRTGQVYMRFFHYVEMQAAIFVFIDTGKEFNPLENEAKAIENDANLKEGGLGIFIVKNFAKEISYSRINGNNILIVQVSTAN